MSTAYAYIDGWYLLKHAGQTAEPRVNPWEVARVALLQLREPDPTLLLRLNLYNAEDESGPIHDYHSRVEQLLNCSVRTGEIGPGLKRGQPANRTQKGVDVLLAVEMLADAQERNYDVAVLVAGDADFVPLVSAVRRLGRRVILGYSAVGVSGELIRAVDATYQLPDDLSGSSF